MVWKKNYGSYGGYNNFGSDDDVGVSKWHSATLINQRLHNIWLVCQKKYVTGEMEGLNDYLDMAWTELFPDATQEQKEQMEKFDKDIFDLSMQKLKAKKVQEHRILKCKHALRVKSKFLFLKFLEKKQGLGKSYQDKFEDDID
jgi:hypothetical protein